MMKHNQAGSTRHKVNILYTKRRSDDYLKLSLHNLNLSEDMEDFDVHVYIGEDLKDNIGKIDFSVYNKLKVSHIYVENLPEAAGRFCRGHILNIIMQKMRRTMTGSAS